VSDELKQAKAVPAAAKAEAKALRPWYKKKRWWLIAVIVIVIASSATGGGSSDSNKPAPSSPSENSSSDSNSTSDTVSKGLGSKDASADIVSLKCSEEDALGFRTPVVRVTNNSSKASDYFIDIVAESSDGSEQFDTTMATITNLSPGQSTNAEAIAMTKKIPAGAVCKIKSVQRTASN